MSLPGIPDAIEGSLDGVLAGRVCGWARDPEMPEAMLEIEIEIDAEVIGHGRCDHFREDLVAAGVGSGRHGFAVPIGTDWNDGLAHEIRVRAAGTDLEIDNSPLKVVVGGEPSVTRLRAPRPGPFAADTVRAREGSYDALRRRAERRGSVAIVAIHQRVPARSGALDGYLRALDANGSAVLVVDTTEGGAPIDADVAPLVLRRANVAWDFGSWLAGVHEVRDLVDEIEELVLTNDSVFGPLYDLRESWEHPRVAGADFWGITDSWQIGYHLQSYFMVLRRRALAHPAFWRFLAGYPFPTHKRQVVRDGEIGLSSALLAAGLRSAVTCPYETVARRWLDDLPERLDRTRAQPENAVLDPAALEAAVGGHVAGQGLRHLIDTAAYIRRGLPHNPSHVFWDTLVRDFRCPFLKRELLLVNPAEVPYATDARDVLERNTDYDPGHIVAAARLIPGSRVPLL